MKKFFLIMALLFSYLTGLVITEWTNDSMLSGFILSLAFVLAIYFWNATLDFKKYLYQRINALDKIKSKKLIVVFSIFVSIFIIALGLAIFMFGMVFLIFPIYWLIQLFGKIIE